jgi:hypothetical protein
MEHKMKKNISILISLFILSVMSLYAQETFSNKDAGIQLTVPGGWTYENDGNTFSFNPPDKDFFIILSINEAENVEKLVEELINSLNKSYSDVKLDDPKDDEQNGMKGWSITGTGKTKNGVDVIILYGMFATPKDKVLELGVIGTKDILEKYSKEIDMIDKSLKPL